MKNLRDLGVQELNNLEVSETQGGFIPVVIWGVALTAGEVAGLIGGTALGVAVSQDLDALADAFMEGFNATK